VTAAGVEASVPDDVRLAPGTGRMHSARSGKINAEASAAALAAAAAGDALTRVHVTPLGEMPGPALAGFTALDILVRGWVAGNTIAGSYDAAGQLFSELTAAAIDFGDLR
jgi:hypothetical protein